MACTNFAKIRESISWIPVVHMHCSMKYYQIRSSILYCLGFNCTDLLGVAISVASTGSWTWRVWSLPTTFSTRLDKILFSLYYISLWYSPFYSFSSCSLTYNDFEGGTKFRFRSGLRVLLTWKPSKQHVENRNITHLVWSSRAYKRCNQSFKFLLGLQICPGEIVPFWKTHCTGRSYKRVLHEASWSRNKALRNVKCLLSIVFLVAAVVQEALK